MTPLPHRIHIRSLLLGLFLVASAAPALAFDRPLIDPQCASDLSRLRSQFPDMDPGYFYLIVRHQGDPQSAEWLGQVTNPVTWDVGVYSGFRPSAPISNWQRGYYDLGPPAGSSAVQWQCDHVGFLLNTYQFTHTVPLVGGGPNIVYELKLPTPQPDMWTKLGSGLVIETDVKLPWVYAVQLDPATGRGTGQVSLFYYAESAVTGRIFAHVIGLFDSRPYGTGNGNEALGHDTFYDFASSPLNNTTFSGAATRYVRVGADSARFQNESGWTDTRHFRVEIGYEEAQRILADLQASFGSETNPSNFRLRSIGLLVEAFPGSNNDHNVSLGGSLSGFTVKTMDPELVFFSGMER